MCGQSLLGLVSENRSYPWNAFAFHCDAKMPEGKQARPLKAQAGAILSLPPHSVGKSNHMVKPNVKS